MLTTIAEKYFNDPQINEALDILEKTLLKHREAITSIRPAQEELKVSYAQAMKTLGENRGGSLYYPYIGSGIGNGPFVELADGSVKYDFIIGIGVHYLGHSHPKLMRAMVKGALANTAMQGHLQQNTDQAKFIATLLKYANQENAHFNHCFLTTTGVMAGENALKIAFQKKHPASRVLAFNHCFMGRTLALSQVTDKAAYREGLPATLSVDYLPFYCESDHAGSIKATLTALKNHIHRYPKQHAAICMELIQGEAGSWVGHTEFFKEIIKVCKENNIAIIVDEVQTFGRTSKMFAFQHFNLNNDIDIVTVGKNTQVCATLFRSEFAPRPGLLSQTFTASGASLAAGQAIVDHLAEGNYFGENGKIQKINAYFTQKLQALEKKHPEKITGPYGIGAMIGMTLFKGDANKSKDFTMKLFDQGVISFTAGGNPTRVRFLLPIAVIEEKHIDDVVVIMDNVLSEMN